LLPERLELELAVSGCLLALLSVDFERSPPIADDDPELCWPVVLEALPASWLERLLDPEPLLDAISDWLCCPCRWLRQVSKSLWNFCSQSRQ
jgi:hypothetical protein